jgi:hypothetical protein
MSRLNLRGSVVGGSLIALATFAGCGPTAWERVQADAVNGEFGRARKVIATSLEPDKKSRRYMYDRMLLAMLDLADGCPASAAPTVDEIFTILRTQGINADKTVASVVTYEGIKFWKGEPFEQAMMFYYTAVQKAMLDEWDNARAAAANSLFLLKNFGEDEAGNRKSSWRLATEANAAERKRDSKGDYLDTSYQAQQTTFVLGHLLKGVANAALGASDPDRTVEAQEDFDNAGQVCERLKQDHDRRKALRDRAVEEQQAKFAALREEARGNAALLRIISRNERTWRASLDPGLEQDFDASRVNLVRDRLRSGDYNTVLVVDYGLGPTKVRYGPYEALARFDQLRGWPSDALPLTLSMEGREEETFPAVCDLNEMARDHMWTGMEDVRVAKGHVGTAMVIAGAAVASSGDRDAAYAGLALALAGLAVQASAKADVRHCEFMPQRVYLAPISIRRPDTTITLRVGDGASCGITLCGLDPPPRGRKVQLRYVRLTPVHSGPPWAWTGKVVYANDEYAGRVDGDDLPYILGGACVRRPSQEVLAHYQSAGHLVGMTVADLESLYHDEGISLGPDMTPGRNAPLHVLEGGNSLECPLAGSAGFARLFCQPHAPYVPKTRQARELAGKYDRSSANTTLAGR